MSTQLSKTYEPQEVETEALRVWNEENLFHAEPTDPGKPYSIVIPPPNVTAALHLGHALNNTLQDILTRWHRMMGDNTVWLPGTDHAGIATQTVVEKRVLKDEGKKRTDFKREEFVAKIQAWKDEYEQTITAQLKRMGCSCDWQRQAFTMDEQRAKAVREAFFQLFKDGLIYRGKRLVNWDPATQTALADDEVEMREVDGHFYYLKYPVVDEHAPSDSSTGFQPVQHGLKTHATEYITVATTRPETMLGDTAVALNPRDPRAASLRGKTILLPIVNRLIPIIEDDYVVLANPESDDPKARYATGFLKVTPAHDPNDYTLGQKHNLPIINVMAPDGTISDQHGWTDVGDGKAFVGLDRYQARKAIVDWFRSNGLLEDVKPYKHTVGHSYRSHVPIEPYLSDQWYLKVTDDRLSGAALRAMATDQKSSTEDLGLRTESNADSPTQSSALSTQHSSPWQGGLRFYPARYAKTFQTWHENIRDWCISRQLWWGHRIPVWYMFWDGPFATTPSDSQLVKLELPFLTANENSHVVTQVVRERKDARILFAVCVAPGNPEVETKLQNKGAWQDPDVLDTWFSSGLWPMSTLDWPNDSALSTQSSALNTWNPTSLLTTAREIITLWVSRMVMFNLYFLNRLPFSDVFIHAMIQDGEGRKMSKSLGNGVDPLDIIESHGSDAMRFTLAHMTTQTQDVRMPVERDAKSGKNTSPKFDIGRNFCNKMWNAARFALMNLENEAARDQAQSHGGTETRSGAFDLAKLSLFDRWILARLNATIGDAEAALKTYRFDAYAKACYDFFWRDLCDWYVEAIKPAMKDPARARQSCAVLAAALDGALRLMHPVVPFITETIFWKLNEVRADRSIAGVIELKPSARLINAAWPRRLNEERDIEAEKVVSQLQEIIGAIRNLRNEHKVDQKRVISVSIKPDAALATQIESNREVIELLAMCTLKAIDPTLSPIANAAKACAAGAEIFVEAMVDEAAETQRIAKRIEELRKIIAGHKGRLANEAYVAKAPAKLVQETKDQLAGAEKEMASLGG